MTILLFIVAPILFGSWALSSVYDWMTRSEHDGASPPLWALILAMAFGVTLIILGTAEGARRSGFASKGGIGTQAIFAAERIAKTAIMIVPNIVAAVFAGVKSLVGL